MTSVLTCRFLYDHPNVHPQAKSTAHTKYWKYNNFQYIFYYYFNDHVYPPFLEVSQLSACDFHSNACHKFPRSCFFTNYNFKQLFYFCILLLYSVHILPFCTMQQIDYHGAQSLLFTEVYIDMDIPDCPLHYKLKPLWYLAWPI